MTTTNFASDADYYNDSSFSYSKAKLYDENPLEYKHVFIDKIKPQYESPALMACFQSPLITSNY